VTELLQAKFIHSRIENGKIENRKFKIIYAISYKLSNEKQIEDINYMKTK